jgi:M6 family metalloprotease-like protein
MSLVFSFCYDNDMKRIPLIPFIVLPVLLVNHLSDHVYPSAFQPESYAVQYQQVRQFEGYRTSMPSTGLVNILVIPISFSDASCQVIEAGCEETLSDINDAFFADEGELPWHSVASYYHKSSYGKLTIEGTVSPWYTPTITAVQLSNQSSLLHAQVIAPALAWYQTQFPYAASQFDRDQDGYLDAVYFIYSVPFNPDGDQYGDEKDIYWAFVSYVGGQKNIASPTLFSYGWSSYQFMYEDGTYDRATNGRVLYDEDNEPIFNPYRDEEGHLTVDAHVYIHEVGHLLGLVDYYSYQRNEGDWGPSGTLDMMDYNVGDHNAYSKSVLNWTTPTVVQDSGTFTLSSFTETGQYLIITPQYQDTLLDQYIIVEFSTPTGLNQKDALSSYAGRYPRVFSNSGIKIYHVDARIAEMTFVNSRLQFNRYVTALASSSSFSYRIAHSNTRGRSVNPDYKLIHLLERSGVNTFRHGGFATNQTLFQAGDVFNQTTHQGFKLNDGTAFPFTIAIGQITNGQVTITVQRLQ